MAFAAIPKYLGNDFSSASPGLRFGMYLALWGLDTRSKERLWTTHDIQYEIRGQEKREREVKKENKVDALNQAAKLNDSDLKLMAALLARQQAQFGTCAIAERYALQAQSISPFATGLGNEHPLENGFAFVNPYGLPYLPGSGCKGVLRQAARELARGDWGDTQGWSEPAIQALFGSDQDLRNEDAQALRGALCIWDVLPQIKGKLTVEIMTPHFSHYYQPRNEPEPRGNAQRRGPAPGRGNDPQRDRNQQGEAAVVSPHESGQPNPIPFLTVPPGSEFCFHFTCNSSLLGRTAPELADGRWRELLRAAALHAFEWLGFGAKTAVGYGAMQVDADSEKRFEGAQAKAREERVQAQLASERQARLAAMSPRQQQIESCVEQWRELHAKLRGKQNNPYGKEHNDARHLARTALASTDWTADEKRELAEAIEQWLPKIVRVDAKDLRKDLKLNQLKGIA